MLQNGYWHARSLEYTGSTLARTLEWMRTPGDLVFIFAGVVPIVLGLLVSYRGLWSGRALAMEVKLAR